MGLGSLPGPHPLDARGTSGRDNYRCPQTQPSVPGGRTPPDENHGPATPNNPHGPHTECSYPHPTDGDTEAQRREEASPRPPSEAEASEETGRSRVPLFTRGLCLGKLGRAGLSGPPRVCAVLPKRSRSFTSTRPAARSRSRRQSRAAATETVWLETRLPGRSQSVDSPRRIRRWHPRPCGLFSRV